MSIIAKILGGRTEAEAGPDFFRQELTKAEKACETAKADVEAADVAYKGSLLAVDAKVSTSAKARLMDAQVAAERAEALVEELRTRFKASCEVAAEGERRHRYDEAVKRREQAIKRLGEYPALAKQIASILTDTAEVELAVASANSDLPEGVEAIESVELSVCWPQSIPQEIVSDEVVSDGWHFATGPDKGSRVDEHRQAECKPKHVGSRIGTLARAHRGTISIGTHDVVAKRKKRVVEILPGVSRYQCDKASLAHDVSLPGLRHNDPPIWASNGMSRVFSSDPASWAKATLEKADALAVEAARGPVDHFGGNRFPRTQEDLIDEPELLVKAEEFARSREGVGE